MVSGFHLTFMIGSITLFRSVEGTFTEGNKGNEVFCLEESSPLFASFPSVQRRRCLRVIPPENIRGAKNE